MFMLSGLVGMLCGSGYGTSVLAVDVPFPPPVQFIDRGVYTGTLQTQGMTQPITGTLDYLFMNSSLSSLTKLSVDTGGQQITSDL